MEKANGDTEKKVMLLEAEFLQIGFARRVDSRLPLIKEEYYEAEFFFNLQNLDLKQRERAEELFENRRFKRTVSNIPHSNWIIRKMVQSGSYITINAISEVN